MNRLCYPQGMQITFTVPDEVAEHVASEGKSPAQAALEALALEGYRTEKLSESDVRQMLGFETRMQVHAFLKQHDVYLNYSLAELEDDLHSVHRRHREREHQL